MESLFGKRESKNHFLSFLQTLYETFEESFEGRWVVSEKDEYSGTCSIRLFAFVILFFCSISYILLERSFLFSFPLKSQSTCMYLIEFSSFLMPLEEKMIVTFMLSCLLIEHNILLLVLLLYN